MEKFKKYLYFGTLGLFVYMPFHIFLSQWLSTFTGGLEAWKAAKDVFTAILVSALVLTVLITRKYTKKYLYLVGFAAVFLVLHMILLFGTDQPLDTGLLATVYNNRIVWYLLIGYSLVLLVPRLARPATFAKVLVAASAIVCLFAIVQRFLPPDFLTHFGYSIERGTKPNFFIDDKPDFPRVFSTIRDPNSLGAFLILPSTIALLALIRFWKTDRRMFFAGLVLLHGLTMILTFSRSAWIAMFLAHASLILITLRAHLKNYIRPLAITFAVLVVIAGGIIFALRDQYFVQNVIFHADESTVLEDPNELRVSLAKRGLEGVAENPEGNGPGTAGLVSTRLPNGLLTENFYLQIAYEVGVIGMILFVGLLLFLLRELWLQKHRFMAEVLFASFIGLAFMNLLLHTWANEAVAASWWIMAGLLITAAPKIQRKAKKTKPLQAKPD